jgi:hypothetical protein
LFILILRAKLRNIFELPAILAFFLSPRGEDWQSPTPVAIIGASRHHTVPGTL